MIEEWKSAVFPVGTAVEWTYRSAVGHGTVAGYAPKGVDHAHTRYKLAQHDDHVSASGSKEPKFVYHWGTDVRKRSS